MDTSVWLVLLAFMLGAPFAACGYWLYLDARERAEMRRQEAAMADALRDSVRQARGRYLTNDPDRPE